MTWHGYIVIENLNLNDAQRQTLVDALRALGPATADQPARLCHWRTRLDGQAAIFEAAFDEDALTVSAFKARLAAIFDVDPATIGHSVQFVTLDSRPTPVVMFERGGTNYLRMALFGGPSATWAESGDECRAYLAAYRGEWEAED